MRLLLIYSGYREEVIKVKRGLVLFLVGVALCFVFPLIVQALWRWVMPLCFPKAVEGGYIASELSYKIPLAYFFIVVGLGVIKSLLNDLIGGD